MAGLGIDRGAADRILLAAMRFLLQIVGGLSVQGLQAFILITRWELVIHLSVVTTATSYPRPFDN